MYPNVECVVISGASAAAIKIAFDNWRDQWKAKGNKQNTIVISASMFAATDLIVFYYTPIG
jgi:hypothetical protein